MGAAMKKQAAILFLRNSFPRLKPQPCMVCGKYRSIAHMHHVIPISEMAEYLEKYNVDVFEAVHLNLTVVWLCPNHHALWHKTRVAGADRAEAFADLSRAELEGFQRIDDIESRAANEFIEFVFGLPGVSPFKERNHD